MEKEYPTWVALGLSFFLGVIVMTVVHGISTPVDAASSWNPVVIWRTIWTSSNNPVLMLLAPEAAELQRAAAGAMFTAGAGVGTWGLNKVVRKPGRKGLGEGGSVCTPTRALRPFCREEILLDDETPEEEKIIVLDGNRGENIIRDDWRLRSYAGTGIKRRVGQGLRRLRDSDMISMLKHLSPSTKVRVLQPRGATREEYYRTDPEAVREEGLAIRPRALTYI